MLYEDHDVNTGAEVVVADGIICAQMEHKATLEGREQAKEQKKLDKIKAAKDKDIRKENRKVARIKAKKDEDLAAWKAMVEDKIVYKGTTNKVLELPLSDVFGNYTTDP